MLIQQHGSHFPREATRLFFPSPNHQPLPCLVLLALLVINTVWITAADVQVVQGVESGDTGGTPIKRSDSVRNIDLLTRRSALDKNFMRFGRAGADNFMRFGRGNRPDNMLRFGRGESTNFMRFGRKNNDDNSSNVMRFGRGNDRDATNYMRFGRAYDDYDYEENLNRNIRRNGPNNFLRFGRGSDNFMRFGRDNSKSNEQEEPIDNHPIMEHEDASSESEYRKRRAVSPSSWIDTSSDFDRHPAIIWRQRRALASLKQPNLSKSN